MTFRPSARELVQIGVETTPGTAVAATKRLSATMVSLRPSASVSLFTPSGSILPGVAAEDNRWVTGEMSGRPTYDELTWILAAHLTAPTTTTPTGATNARQHDFTFSGTTTLNPRSFTIEQGSVGGGAVSVRAAYCRVNTLSLTFSRNQIELSGSVLGRDWTTGFSMTSLTDSAAYPLVPILGKQLDLYFADTFTGLGSATRYDGGFQIAIEFPERFARVDTINSQVSGFAALVEQVIEPRVTLRLTVHDAMTQDLYSKLSQGSKKFVRLQATGPLIETGQNYLFRMDLALFVADAPNYTDDQNVRVTEWNCVIANDPNSVAIRLVNTQQTVA